MAAGDLLLSVRTALYVQLTVALLANVSGAYSYNIAVFILLAWAVHTTEAGIQPLMIATCSIVFSMVLDLVVLGVYAHDIIHQDADGHKVQVDTAKFALGMLMLSLLLKPWTLYVTARELKFRTGLSFFHMMFSDSSTEYSPPSDQYKPDQQEQQQQPGQQRYQQGYDDSQSQPPPPHLAPVTQ
eukprot:m.6736 g.6736  ORF g.6736 m.6736 type:complete len:184 (-) comp4372_c0_seq1:52-603(-)